MKKLALMLVVSSVGFPLSACNNDANNEMKMAHKEANQHEGDHKDMDHDGMTHKEEAVQHIEVPEVTSEAEAERIFVVKTQEIQTKQKLDAAELQDIHMITYTLEQSMVYYVKNLTGERQALATEMAAVVEDIHIASENNRQTDAQKHLDKYFQLANKFAMGL